MNWLIGIDGGGTKTVGWAADSTGKCLARVEKGPSNYHTTGLANFKAVIVDVVDELSVACGLSKADVSIISLGLAGVDRVRDREIVLSALAELGLDCQYIVNSDAKAALVAGLGRAEGIVLIAGTGSVAYGINKQGEVTRAGGWGHLASDEGSGYAIGRQALLRGIKAAEQRDMITVLIPSIIKHFDLQSWDEMIGFINSRETTKADIASLAQVVAAAAQEGDDVAAEILIKAGDDLADLVKSVITRGFESAEQVQVCLYGSIVRNIALVHKRLVIALSGKASLVSSDREPAEGAMLLGLEWIRQKEWEKCN